MRENEDPRAGSRVRTRFEAAYSGERREGSGWLADISYTGALIEGASIQPRVGMRVRLHVFLPHRDEPLEIAGVVVRHTENGFAIAYQKPDPAAQRLVDDAAALVSAPVAVTG